MERREYFIVAESYPAPFVGDRSFHYAKGYTPDFAAHDFRDTYRHPCGLYTAVVYASADAYHKGEKPLRELAFPRLSKSP